jgi:hypothetical protein
MSGRQIAAVAGTAVALVAIIVILLVTGGAGSDFAFDDPAGDVSLAEGSLAGEDLSLADILHTEVRPTEGGVVFFEARLATAIPERLSDPDIDLRWEVTEDGEVTWLVFANLDFGPTAYVLAQKTNYGSSTIDETLPGTVEIRGDTLSVRLRTSELPDFPPSFEWHLETTLTGDAIGTDRAPDEGGGKLEG